MRMRADNLCRMVNSTFFIGAFFLQSFVDGYYIANGVEPALLKEIKYGLVLGGILWGFLQLSGRKRLVFVKEFRNVLFAVVTMLLVSLLLILVRGGDLMFCLELTLRYAMSVCYAFVLLNVLRFEDVWNLMVCFLLFSVFGWILQMGERLLDASLYLQISFADSYSPFESHYFAPSAMNCCAFFRYYRKNRWTQVVSFLFALMTFKRVQIVFAVLLLLLPVFFDPGRQLRRGTRVMFCVGIVALTLCYYCVLQPEGEWILQKLTGQSADVFTMGRSTLLRRLVDSGYRMGGLGTSEAVLGRGIEMDLISIMVEMSFPVMVVLICCYASAAGRKAYAMMFLLYLMVLMLTGSGLYNVFLWTIAFLFFGSINYLKPEPFPRRRRRIRIRISR